MPISDGAIAHSTRIEAEGQRIQESVLSGIDFPSPCELLIAENDIIRALQSEGQYLPPWPQDPVGAFLRYAQPRWIRALWRQWNCLKNAFGVKAFLCRHETAGVRAISRCNLLSLERPQQICISAV